MYCTVLLPLGVNPTAVNKHIYIYLQNCKLMYLFMYFAKCAESKDYLK